MVGDASHFMSDFERSLPRGISVVVPVYNSEATLADLIARLWPVFQRMGRPYELVLVNDASLDGSWQMIEKLALENNWLRGIDLMRNQGQENALLCGIRA